MNCLPFALSIYTAYDARAITPVIDYGTRGKCELTSSNPGEGSLRLFDGATNNTGVVQVYQNGRWGGICVDTIRYDRESLDVTCRQLGYRSWVSAGSVNICSNVVEAHCYVNESSCRTS